MIINIGWGQELILISEHSSNPNKNNPKENNLQYKSHN